MVYFIQGEKTGLIKIGKTRSIRKRLATLQASSPDQLTVLAVIKGAHNDHKYHARFVKDWSHGEWFKPSGDMITFIGKISSTEYVGYQRKPSERAFQISLRKRFNKLCRTQPEPLTADENQALLRVFGDTI